MVHSSWDNSLYCQTPALKQLPDFCVMDPGSKGRVEVDVGSEFGYNEQVSDVSGIPR